MKTAVMTLTRDRLDYTKHCFAALQRYAGCDFDHYILDNGSKDGTAAWLHQYNTDTLAKVIWKDHNIGIGAGLNELLDYVADCDYDVVVKFDNDCELTQENTLRDVAELVVRGGCILSPRILGLRHPPPTMATLVIGDQRILEVPHVGGIFLAAPAGAFDAFRYSEQSPTWGGDDSEICQWFRAKGGTCGYVERLEAWHYQTTDGQIARYPHYQARKERELEQLGWVTA